MSARSNNKDPRTNEELVASALQGDEDDEQAWDAIRELQRRGTREVLEISERLLRSPVPKERGRGADVLAQLGSPERTFRAKCVDALLAGLRQETDPAALNSMAVALGHLGDRRAVPVLVPLKDHPDSEVRSGVVLGLLGHADDAAVEALIQLSSDADEEIRNWATFGLGSQLEEVDSPELRDALAHRLSDVSAEVRGEALVGLAMRKDARVFEPLRQELSGESVSLLAVEAAELLGDRSLLPLLTRLRDGAGKADAHFEKVLAGAIAALEDSRGPTAR